MSRGIDIVRSNAGVLKKADIVLITDGGSDAQQAPQLREQASTLGISSLGLGIGVDREWLVPWCEEIQVVTDLNRIDDQSADRLFAA
jgi:hypothetical protein